MPYTFEQLIAELHTGFGNSYSHLLDGITYGQSAGEYLFLEDYPNAILYTLLASDSVGAAVEDIILRGDYGYGDPTYLIPTALDPAMAFPELGDNDLTMGRILSVMLQADPSEVLYFIGLVDAYRQSVWNQPFNKEYYAALARGFREWE